MNQIELEIMTSLNHAVGCPLMDTVMPIVTLFGEGGIFFIATAIILLIRKKTRKTGVALSLAMIIGVLVANVILKNLVARTRPCDLCNVTLLIPRLSDYSFPSGHTLVCFEATSVFYCMKHRTAALLTLFLSVIVGFSRIYLFVHFPTDVLGAALIGIGIGCLASFIIQQIERRNIGNIRRFISIDP